MQVTVELILTVAISISSGATVAWLSNRVMNAEMFGHLKRHCAEIGRLTEQLDNAIQALGKHSERLGILEYQQSIDRQRRHRQGD